MERYLGGRGGDQEAREKAGDGVAVEIFGGEGEGGRTECWVNMRNQKVSVSKGSRFDLVRSMYLFGRFGR